MIKCAPSLEDHVAHKTILDVATKGNINYKMPDEATKIIMITAYSHNRSQRLRLAL